jgi:leucyl aminopeptidase (aminopeptidase T)
MLARAMSADVGELRRRGHALAEILTRGSRARITCANGSDLTLRLEGRTAIPDTGELTEPGAFGNLPCGEGFIAPLDGQGRVVASTLGVLGIADEPATLTVSEGRIVGADGGLGQQFLDLLHAHGELGSNLAELGVGTNDRARLTGLVLEDEKIMGTVHVAFGASIGIGGTVSVPIHLDVVVRDASLEVDGRRVLDAGRYVLH